jgi:vacuolar-type H+-ATPase subunit I/STV1
MLGSGSMATSAALSVISSTTSFTLLTAFSMAGFSLSSMADLQNMQTQPSGLWARIECETYKI